MYVTTEDANGSPMVNPIAIQIAHFIKARRSSSRWSPKLIELFSNRSSAFFNARPFFTMLK
jgi:hydroxymethylglutaryl-CoA reductase